MAAPMKTSDTVSPLRRVKSLDHALDVLEELGRASGDAGVSDLARSTGLSKATVHNILTTLEQRQFVRRNPRTARYSLGWSLYSIGALVVRDVDVGTIPRPFLGPLAQASGESVLVGVLYQDSVLYVDRAEHDGNHLRMVANIGTRTPLHATASGKVLLAHQPPAVIERILGHLPKYTSKTITDPSTLRRHLAIVRKRGYATCLQEHELGLSAVSVPLRDHSNEVAAALTLAAPSMRMNSRVIPRQLATLRGVAAQIEGRLGAQIKSSD